jgi:hypothetical protein
MNAALLLLTGFVFGIGLTIAAIALLCPRVKKTGGKK